MILQDSIAYTLTGGNLEAHLVLFNEIAQYGYLCTNLVHKTKENCDLNETCTI